MSSFQSRVYQNLLALCAMLLFATGCLSGGPDPYCGDGACNNGETPYGCALDCGPPPNHCGNGRCDLGETHYTCATDCDLMTAYCGDGICDETIDENTTTCVADCGHDPEPPCGPDHLPIVTEGIRLPVVGLPQQCTEWCWAAVSTMVANYYGIGATECGLASIRNGLAQDACCFDQACLYSQCNTPAPPPVIQSILSNTLGIHGLALNSALNPAAPRKTLTEHEVQVELSNGRPFIIGYLNSMAGHVVLVDGFGPSGGGYLYSVEDPFYGHFDVSYNQLAYGYMGGGQSWTWAYTTYHLSPRTDGCNVNFDPSCVCN